MPDDATQRSEGLSVARAAGKPKLVAANPAPEQSPAQVEEKGRVVHIVERLQAETRRVGTLRRRPHLVVSLLICVVLPTLLGSIYYLFIASDIYVSEARFAVRSTEQQAADALGMISGLSGSQNASDSYIVADYLISRDLIRELQQRVPFRRIYADPRADYFSALDPEVSEEELLDYWKRHVDVYFDSTKHTISVEVQAFTPENAQQIATAIVDIVRNLVNDLSAGAREDAVRFASKEAARAELRVRDARKAMLSFRVAHKELDPAQSAEATLGIAAKLEGERSHLASQLASVSGYLADDAPSVQMLKARIAALQGEISRIQGQISSGGAVAEGADAEAAGSDGAMATLIGEYQDLSLNQEFAEKAYVAAMGSLERARAEANRVQSYLAIYGDPSLAQDATYPHRFLSILMIFVMCSVAWAIGGLAYLSIRDHMR